VECFVFAFILFGLAQGIIIQHGIYEKSVSDNELRYQESEYIRYMKKFRVKRSSAIISLDKCKSLDELKQQNKRLKKIFKK